MKVYLKSNWFAPNGHLYQKNGRYPTEIPDSLLKDAKGKSTLPSTAVLASDVVKALGKDAEEAEPAKKTEAEMTLKQFAQTVEGAIDASKFAQTGNPVAAAVEALRRKRAEAALAQAKGGVKSPQKV